MASHLSWLTASGIDLNNIMKKLRKRLIKLIEIDYGLLNEMVSRDLCSNDQVKGIELTTSSHQWDQDIDELLDKVISTAEDDAEDGNQFLAALRLNNQRHLVLFAVRKGRRFPKSHAEFNCWPLDTVRKLRISQNMGVLVEKLDPDGGLVQEWASNGCISHQQCCDIEQTSPLFNRNRKLLNFLLKRSVADYDLFVDCLKKYGQNRLSDLLKISAEEDRRKPKTPQNWRVELKQLCELNYGLLDDLVSRGLQLWFNDRVADSAVGRVLDLMAEKSTTDGQLFLEALKTTGQEHVALFIERSGCRYSCDEELFKCWPLDLQLESRILRNMCHLLDLIKIDVEFVNCLYSSSFINNLQKYDLDETCTDYAKKRKLLKFLFKSSVANYEVFVDCLKTTAQLHVARILEEDVVVETLVSTISSGSFEQAGIVEKWREVLSTDNRETVDRINAILHADVDAYLDIVDIQLDGIRCYVFCRTPRALEALYHKLESGSLVITMESIFNTLLGVDDKVQVLETKGRLSATELRRRLEIFRKDFADPQLLVTLNRPPPDSNGHPRAVRGVAMLDNKIYVVYWEYNRIQVFNCENRFKRVEDIEVTEMRTPRDMVGCSVTSQLFIHDYDCSNDVILRVDSKTGASDVFIELDYINAWLSLVDNRLLVTSRDSLLMYDICCGDRIMNIPLSEDMKEHEVWHAIESGRDSFYVIHGQCKFHRTVSEIDSGGQVIRVFMSKQLHRFPHLVSDSVGRLLVADWNTDSVFLLDDYLRFEVVLLDKKRLNNAWPCKLNYNKNSNKLAVGFLNGHVKIFQCNV